jgi:hypothetical protein
MSRQPPPHEPARVGTPIWSALPGDLQQRAVRLLAQLAFAHFRQQPPSSTQEVHHDRAPQQPQDSPRPSRA